MIELGVEAIDTTLQKTNEWFREVQDELHMENRHRAYLVLRAVLHALRDRLTPDEAAHLGAELPMLIRGIYYEGWSPAGKPWKARRKGEFLEKVAAHFVKEEVDAEKVCLAVFHILQRRISAGEIHDIKHSMPKELLELWEPRGNA